MFSKISNLNHNGLSLQDFVKFWNKKTTFKIFKNYTYIYNVVIKEVYKLLEYQHLE